MMLRSAVGRWLSPWLNRPKAALALTGAGVALSLLILANVDRWAPGWRTAAVLHTELNNSYAAPFRRLLDRDGDGFSPILWGGDCDDEDASVYPGSIDLPGGLDTNCNGAIPTKNNNAQARGLAAPEGSSALPFGEIDRLVLLTIDTFRPELLREDIMPRLSKLAAYGARFTRAYPGGTCTSVSLPLFHAPLTHAPPVIDQIVGAGVDAYSVPFQGRRGFPTPEKMAVIDQSNEHTFTEPALNFLKREGTRPKYLWVHYKGPHAPYETWPDADDPPSVPPLEPAYLSEAMHLDRVIAPLVDWLMEPSRIGRSMVVITSDHGEGMNEHGVKSHCHGAWEEILKVPAVLLAPGVRPGNYDQLITHRGLPATLLGAFGLGEKSNEAEHFGRSWLRVVQAPDAPLNDFVVVRSSRRSSGRRTHAPLAVMIAERFKLVYGIEDQIAELFDLKDDPEERHNLVFKKPDIVEAMTFRLNTMIDLDGYPGTVEVGR